MDIGTHDATATAIGRHKVDAQALVRRCPLASRLAAKPDIGNRITINN